MTSPGATLSANRKLRASPQKYQGKRPQGIAKAEQQARRSTRISQLHQVVKEKKPDNKHSPPGGKELPDYSLLPRSELRKRTRGLEHTASNIPDERPQKRFRSSLAGSGRRQDFAQEVVDRLSASQRSNISQWVERKTWPQEYFQHSNMAHLLARQKLPASQTRSNLSSSIPTSGSDQRPREEKSAPYRKSSYLVLLETLGNSYMHESDLGVDDASKVLVEILLDTKCSTPQDTLFRDDAFHKACWNLLEKNEARVIQDISRLLVPSPETLAALGAREFGILVESVNEGWNNSVPITSTRPQPDFAVGFGRSMFSEDQLRKLQPLLGDVSCLSYFKATYYMYFPVLTCEVKCGSVGLDIADRQNAHSMTLAVRGIVELFKLAKKDTTVHRTLLTFSISHDHRTVRLYGYYPVIDGDKMKIYRHSIHTYDLTARDGLERWRTYRFTMGVYSYSLDLLKRIHSVIDGLPSDFKVAAQPAEPWFIGQASMEDTDRQQGEMELQQITPATSTRAEKSASKKKRKG